MGIKRLTIWLTVLVLLASLCGVSWGKNRGDTDRLTVATYNVHNMVDAFDDPHTRDERTRMKPHHETELIARALRQIDADVVAIQEIENEGMLKGVVNELLDGMGYRYVVVQPTNSMYGANLGIVSRKPIVSITSYRLIDLPLQGRKGRGKRRFTRDLMHTRLQVTPSKILDLFTAHFKSRRDSAGDPKSNRWRQAEAAAARRIIAQVLQDNPSAWVVLAGDLNAQPDSPTLELLTQPTQNGQPALLDVHATVPATQRITYLKPPYRSTIDYLLASPELAKRIIPGSPRVVADPSLLGGSDHAPVVASFDLLDHKRHTDR